MLIFPTTSKLFLAASAVIITLTGVLPAAAQIGPGSLQLLVDNIPAYNGYNSGGTGSPVSVGSTLIGSVTLNGVSGNQGSTSVQCYANNSQIFSWSTAQGGNNAFSWTPSVAATYILGCSATWSGQYANGTVETSTITVPVLAPPVVTIEQGFVNPKYVILGVTYAPPGPSSFVQYTGTTSVGNTSTIQGSFSNQTAFSVSVSSGVGVPGFGPSGQITGTTSTEYTQGSNNSTTNTISKLSSLSYKTTGTGDAFSPINSDYDTIWLWLNPLLLLSYTPATSNTLAGIQWNGYGYDTNDPSGTQQPDVFPVLVGYLNGHFGPNPSADVVLGRSWASTTYGYNWSSGSGPGLTGIGNPYPGSDAANIIAADPLASSSYSLLASHPSTSADGRFTIVTLPQDPNAIPYTIAGPGNGAGTTVSYDVNQVNTQIEAQGTSNSTTQAFSVEEKFSGSLWLAGLSLTLKESNSLTWTHSWLTTLNTTTTIQKAVSITGPPCPAAPPGPCNPLYYNAGQFLIYQDNQFGTFAFYPSNKKRQGGHDILMFAPANLHDIT